jgi:predicted transcriptional regulator
MGRKPNLGRGESEVFRYVAAHCPITVREAADHFAATKGHIKTTTLNVMERLRDKGFLIRESVDGLYRYSPSQPTPGMLRDLVKDFVDEMLGGSLEPFAAYLAEKPKASEAEIARLRETIGLLESESLGSGEKEENGD